MKPYLAIALAILVLLLVALPFSSSANSLFSRDIKLPAAQSTTLPSGYFVPLEVDSLSNSTWLAYSVQSNLTISVALMNSAQFNTFNNSATTDISDSIAYQNGTSATGDYHVSFGAYYIVFYNAQSSGTANITFTDATYPYTPYIGGPLVPPEPMGLASFGLYNVSDNAVPYSVETPTIVGAANISSILAYNASAASVNDTTSGATLQLNAVLVAQGENGTQQVYWIQDTPDFVTSASQVSYNDNAWNNSDLNGFLSNQTMTSPNGPSVFPSGQNESQYYYAYGTNNYTYSEPFDIKLLLNESTLLGQGVLVNVGMQVLRNGSITTVQPVFWFDNITISDPLVQSSYYYVDGNDSTPLGTYYDAELVFGGEGNLEATNFSQMNTTLGLYYLNSSSSQISPFPSYYSFGGDTGESADNLQVAYLGNGTGEVSVGTPNYSYLGTISSIAATSISSSQSSVTTYQSAQSSTSSSTSSGATEISDNYFIALIPVIIVIILSGMIFLSRKKSRIDTGY